MKLLPILIAFVFWVCAPPWIVHAQQNPVAVQVQDTQIPSEPGGPPLEQLKTRQTYQLQLTGIVTGFGILSLLFVAVIFWSSILVETEKVVRLVIVVVVVSASLILITAGYSNEQIAPAFGLFGTIVGYILGTSGRPRLPRDTQQNQGVEAVEPEEATR